MATVETIALATLKLLELLAEQKKKEAELKKQADDVVKKLPLPPKKEEPSGP